MLHANWDTANYRLATYYLKRLQEFTSLYLQGGELISETLANFQEEWGQIRQVQSWTAEQSGENEIAAALCVSFATSGSALIHIRHSPQEQIYWFQPALDSARQLDDLESVSQHLCNIGSSYILLSEYTKSLNCYGEALSLAKLLNNLSVQASAYSGIARCHRRLGNMETATQNEKLSLNMIRTTGNLRHIANALGNRGAGICTEGRYKEAIELLQEALAISQQEGDISGEAQHLINLGVAYLGFEKKRHAISYFEDALERVHILEHKEMESVILGQLAVAHHLLSEYTIAINYYHLAIEIANDFGDRQLTASQWFNLGAAYMQIANYTAAIRSFENAKVIFNEINLLQNATEAQNQIDTINNESKSFLWLLRHFTQLVHTLHMNGIVLSFKNRIERTNKSSPK